MTHDGDASDDDLDIAIGPLPALCGSPERAHVATLFNDIDLVGAAWIVSRRLVLSSEVTRKDETCPMLRFAAVLTLTVAVAGSALAQTRDVNSVVPWRIQDSGAAKSAESERKGFTPSPVWRIQRDDEPKPPAAPATQRPSLGVAVATVSRSDAELFAIAYHSGAYVVGITPGSPAETAGIQPDDVIMTVDDVDVGSSDDLVRQLSSRRVGENISLRLMRDGRLVNAKATLAILPDMTEADRLYTEAMKQFRAPNGDRRRANALARAAADLGHPGGMAHLGWLNTGPDAVGATTDYEQALRWNELAARAGNAQAIANLCWQHFSGKGVARDPGAAMTWCTKGAIAGIAAAMVNLGVLYHHGRGTRRDFDRAMRIYVKAAAAGDSQAMLNIGVLHRDGSGVPVDKAEARRWFEKARAAGADANEHLAGLDAQRSRSTTTSSGDRSGGNRSGGDSGGRNCRPVNDQCQQCGSNPGVGNNCYWVACNFRYVCD